MFNVHFWHGVAAVLITGTVALRIATKWLRKRGELHETR